MNLKTLREELKLERMLRMQAQRGCDGYGRLLDLLKQCGTQIERSTPRPGEGQDHRRILERVLEETKDWNGGKLTFARLREANVERLPLFKNSRGEPAHSEPDGSDWSDAEWLEAVVGELGEYANLKKKIRRGDLIPTEGYPLLAKELADTQIYLDLLAFRLGINLGQAVIDKFNETSTKIDVDVRL